MNQDECGCGGCSPFDRPFEIGQAVPDFELDIYQKESFSTAHLSDFKGKWSVFFFYPADFTFVCPTELEDLADNYAKFQELGVEIFSVSTDTRFAHKAWHDSSPAIKKIAYPMVADPAGELAQYFDVFIMEGSDRGLARRGTFVIDPDGVLQAFEVHANNIGRDAKELIRKIEAAQFVREHGGEVCPARWQPGEKTLKPGIDLVGKI